MLLQLANDRKIFFFLYTIPDNHRTCIRCFNGRQYNIIYLLKDYLRFFRFDDHFLFIQPYNYRWFKKEKFGKLNMVSMIGRKFFQLIFQIIIKMTKKPSALLCSNEILQTGHRIAGTSIKTFVYACSQQTFLCVWMNMVLVIVQKTKSVELLCPVQHFFLHQPEVSYRKYRIAQNNIA